MKYNDCEKNLTQKYELLNYAKAMKVCLTETYSILSSIFIIELVGGGGGGGILECHFGSVWILSTVN